MENENLEKGIKEIQNIQMTALEKENMLKSILNNTVRATKTKPIKSPYSFASMFRNPVFYYAILFIVIAGIGGGGIYFNNQYGKSGGNTGNLATIKNPNQINNVNNVGQENNNIPTNTNTKNRDVAKNTTELSNNTTLSPIGTSGQNINTGTSITSMPMMLSGNYQYEKIASIAFDNYFKELAKKEGSVLDYRIEKVTFSVSKENATKEQLDWFSADTTNNAFITEVDFSVKIAEGGKNGYWMAWGATPNGPDWLNGHLIITIDKNAEGYYVKNTGTSL